MQDAIGASGEGLPIVKIPIEVHGAARPGAVDIKIDRIAYLTGQDAGVAGGGGIGDDEGVRVVGDTSRGEVHGQGDHISAIDHVGMCGIEGG